MKKYVLLEDVTYKWLFEDPPVSQEDLLQIPPLSVEYSSKLWEEHICSERHLMLHKDTSDWISSLELLDYNWDNDWHDDNVNGLSEFFCSRYDIPEGETIIYFMMKEDAIETIWGIFLKNWLNFLYEDEAPILYVPRIGFAIIFYVHGKTYAGYKGAI